MPMHWTHAVVVALIFSILDGMRLLAQPTGEPTFAQFIEASAVPKEVIARFLNGPSWTKFDPELGYVPGNHLPADGMDKSSSISTVQSNGAHTSFLYAGQKCRINTYGDSWLHA